MESEIEHKGKDAKVLLVEGKQFMKEIAEKDVVFYALILKSNMTKKEQFVEWKEEG